MEIPNTYMTYVRCPRCERNSLFLYGDGINPIRYFRWHRDCFYCRDWDVYPRALRATAWSRPEVRG
jgi:hypothetical protein